MKRRTSRRPQLVTMSCKRGCGKTITTLSRPIYSTAEDFERYSGICENCLTEEELADINGPMLHRIGQNIVRKRVAR